MADRGVISIDGTNLFFLDVVRGLKPEAERVLNAVEEVKPDILAMSIAKEEVAGLKEFAKEPFEVEMSRYEELYAKRLSKFGDVFLPPPCYLSGLEASQKKGIELIPIDMDDDSHSTAYCALVTGRELLIHSMRLNIIKMKFFNAKNPWDFAIQWDRRVNNLRGFRELEKEREIYMADELRKLSETRKRILAIIDVERAGNVRRILSNI